MASGGVSRSRGLQTRGLGWAQARGHREGGFRVVCETPDPALTRSGLWLPSCSLTETPELAGRPAGQPERLPSAWKPPPPPPLWHDLGWRAERGPPSAKRDPSPRGKGCDPSSEP